MQETHVTRFLAGSFIKTPLPSGKEFISESVHDHQGDEDHQENIRHRSVLFFFKKGEAEASP